MAGPVTDAAATYYGHWRTVEGCAVVAFVLLLLQLERLIRK